MYNNYWCGKHPDKLSAQHLLTFKLVKFLILDIPELNYIKFNYIYKNIKDI